jgi:NAD(P)-dependent dehydrogenase (short-subunit alcohol dehydrogenase family)
VAYVAIVSHNAGSRFVDAMLTSTILVQVAEPIEFSYPVLFLASDESSLANLPEVIVDGGYTAK